MRIAREADIWLVLAVLVLFFVPGILMVVLPIKSEVPSRALCVARVQSKLILAVLVYADENDGVFPSEVSDLDAGSPFRNALLCPVKRGRQTRWEDVDAGGWGDYVYRGAGQACDDLEDPERVPIFFDKPGNHPDGTCTVAFADGHVELLSQEELALVLQSASRR